MSAQALLIEIGTEDLPARYVVPLANALATGISDGLRKRGIVYQQHVQSFSTPRRIAVMIAGVATQQPDRLVKRDGPAVAVAYKDGKPTPAALGFAKSCGVEFSELVEKDGKLHFSKSAPGKATAALIPEIFEETLKQMDELVPKRMRWGSGNETFVRPVQWIAAMLGEQVIPLQRFDLVAGNITYGHRFHAPAAIKLKSPADYEAALKAAKVWADMASRKAEIKRQIEAEAAKLGGQARITEDLLDEVAALVEWPVVISGRMEERFMQLPPEVIIATVETNQRYFTVFDAQKKLLPVFITISNIESKDVQQVIAGNERVVRPRLSDALFFWEQDLKQPLEAYSEKLATVTFQKELGSIGDKVERIRKLATEIVGALKIDANAANRAAVLCKNDLVTKMVYEIPELQGLMGGYYAKKSGESAAVVTAIREHYLPTQQGTSIPSTREGQIVALADKLDTLAGIFTIGQKPTASKDPFALRRTALGVLRILIEGKLSLNIVTLLSAALENQPVGKRDSATLVELTEFVLERLRAYYGDQNLPVEMFEAVKSLGMTSPLDFDARVQALRGFWALPEAKNLAAAHKRVRNILKQAGNVAPTTIDTKLFEHESERTLHSKLVELEKSNATADYSTKLLNLATLRVAVDAFFDGVMVNAENPAVRANRLALLRALDSSCREVADISCLPG
ncbi:MAG: glycine--tRNA ligase subunit beta [Stenotrophobium sp.]